MRNIQVNIVLLAAVIAVLPFTSCMHTIMMSGHKTHDGMEQATIIKEVSDGAATLSVTVPPLTAGRESPIAISLTSNKQIPDSVTLHYVITQTGMDDGSPAHEHGTTIEPGAFKSIHQSVPVINGSATIAYTPTQAGHFSLSAQSQVDSVSLTAELNFMVHSGKGHGMMGLGAMWDYPLIGILAMSAMMLVMWGIRGGL